MVEKHKTLALVSNEIDVQNGEAQRGRLRPPLGRKPRFSQGWDS